MNDKRKHERYPFTTDIKISHPTIGEKIVKSKDVSDSGVFILVEPTEMPPIGEVVEGQVQGGEGDMPVLKMRIVRVGADGLGLQFVDV